jgi:LmbE family N-acetylglucosaminyl deacetylase
VKILAVAAHPDDETLGAGGTLALHSAQGDEVWVCILSEGVTSRHDQVELQQECAQRACATLGVRRVIFCMMPDQGLDVLPLTDLVTPIEQCIRDLEPEIVLTHFSHDANQDHRAVFNATLVATRPPSAPCVRRVMCWETPSSTEWAAPFPGSVFAPNVFVDITTTLDVKLAAMKAYADTHVSEVRPYPHPRSYEALDVYARRNGVAAGLHAAEAFMLVREIAQAGLTCGRTREP